MFIIIPGNLSKKGDYAKAIVLSQKRIKTHTPYKNSSSGSMINAPKEKSSKLSDIIQMAYKLGASEATVIPAKKIIVEDHLAEFCKDPRCENYGLSKSCPPYVSGPLAFKNLLEKFQQAVFFKIDVPSKILFSADRREIFQLLHQVTAGIKDEAVKKENWAGINLLNHDRTVQKRFCHDKFYSS